MRSKKVFKLIILPILCILVVSLPAVLLVYIMVASGSEITKTERQLLYHTSHADLNSACEFIWKNKTRFRPDPYWHLPSADQPDPTDPLMPSIIHGLPPCHIFVGDKTVRLEFGGGFLHYGIDWFEAGVKGEGTKELLPGLWYYAENGAVPLP